MDIRIRRLSNEKTIVVDKKWLIDCKSDEQLENNQCWPKIGWSTKSQSPFGARMCQSGALVAQEWCSSAT